MIINVSDIDIAELEIYKNLRDAAFRSDNSFIADSPKVVNILLEQDIEVKSILATPEYYDEFKSFLTTKNIPKIYLTSNAEMQKIVGHRVHHNCMMHGVRPLDKPLDELGDKIIMLDNITSSENVGSIARSAAALGVDSYLLPKESPHPFSRRSLRVSMGHSSLLKTHIYDDVKEAIKNLQKSGYRVYAAEVKENATPLSKLQVAQKWVLLMGHEGHGIADEILALCDEVVTIEMQEGIKSFNVGVAASIMMYQFLHQR
ncbi:RNA methyltransferase [Sulfurimonas aquatica]|uniref:RNA methyltransferase n=1 Tax=Sulfurimonas aquatica TaxID=2672570 RepID=A0A975AY54_9BACT|nr:RNA methyltransferase [Sulfurimonas aquatica]QSZ40757.1 RNA methyltransferase [Sulfurimonas aquatica]